MTEYIIGKNIGEDRVAIKYHGENEEKKELTREKFKKMLRKGDYKFTEVSEAQEEKLKAQSEEDQQAQSPEQPEQASVDQLLVAEVEAIGKEFRIGEDGVWRHSDQNRHKAIKALRIDPVESKVSFELGENGQGYYKGNESLDAFRDRLKGYQFEKRVLHENDSQGQIFKENAFNDYVKANEEVILNLKERIKEIWGNQISEAFIDIIHKIKLKSDLTEDSIQEVKYLNQILVDIGYYYIPDDLETAWEEFRKVGKMAIVENFEIGDFHEKTKVKPEDNSTVALDDEVEDIPEQEGGIDTDNQVSVVEVERGNSSQENEIDKGIQPDIDDFAERISPAKDREQNDVHYNSLFSRKNKSIFSRLTRKGETMAKNIYSGIVGETGIVSRMKLYMANKDLELNEREKFFAEHDLENTDKAIEDIRKTLREVDVSSRQARERIDELENENASMASRIQLLQRPLGLSQERINKLIIKETNKNNEEIARVKKELTGQMERERKSRVDLRDLIENKQRLEKRIEGVDEMGDGVKEGGIKQGIEKYERKRDELAAKFIDKYSSKIEPAKREMSSLESRKEEIDELSGRMRDSNRIKEAELVEKESELEAAENQLNTLGTFNKFKKDFKNSYGRINRTRNRMSERMEDVRKRKKLIVDKIDSTSQSMSSYEEKIWELKNRKSVEDYIEEWNDFFEDKYEGSLKIDLSDFVVQNRNKFYGNFYSSKRTKLVLSKFTQVVKTYCKREKIKLKDKDLVEFKKNLIKKENNE